MNQNFRNDGMRSVRAAAGVPPRTVNIHNEGEHAESSKKDDSPSPSPSSSSPSPSSSSSSTGVWKRSASKISGRSESIVWEDNVDGECVRLEGFLNKRGEKGLVKSFLRRWFSFDSRSEPLVLFFFLCFFFWCFPFMKGRKTDPQRKNSLLCSQKNRKSIILRKKTKRNLWDLSYYHLFMKFEELRLLIMNLNLSLLLEFTLSKF